MKPLIGLTPSISDNHKQIVLNRDYAEAVRRSGAVPVILPMTDDPETLNALFECLDGMVFTGGADLSPSLYGEQTLPVCGGTEPLRDAMELPLLRRCLDEGIDVPDANIGIVMSSSSVPRQRIQRLGRIIRRSEGKDAACLYYLYIRESADDPSYLEGLQDHPSFSLRYYSAENTFSNDVYEYVASDLLSRSEQNWKNPDKIRELRSCILEGHVRADHLLPEQVQKQNAALAAGQHEQNYWNTMRAIGHTFSE